MHDMQDAWQQISQEAHLQMGALTFGSFRNRARLCEHKQSGHWCEIRMVHIVVQCVRTSHKSAAVLYRSKTVQDDGAKV
eukprot:5653854-Amphidinium_carterae.1